MIWTRKKQSKLCKGTQPKMFEWIPNKEHPYSPFVMLMIRAAYKSRELPYDSHDVTLVNEDGLHF